MTWKSTTSRSDTKHICKCGRMSKYRCRTIRLVFGRECDGILYNKLKLKVKTN